MFSQACRKLSRDTLIAINSQHRCTVLDQAIRDVISRLHLRRRGCRGGNHHRRQLEAAQRVTSADHRAAPGEIPTAIGNRSAHVFHGRRYVCVTGTVLKTVNRCHRDCQPHDTKLISTSSSSSSQPQLYAGNPASSIINGSSSPPALYLLNAAGLAKPHAVQHLAADLASYKCDVAVLTETHFKSKHSEGFVSIPDYTVFRRDRSGHRGGGVAVYVHSSLIPSTWMPTGDNNSFELLWVRVGNTFIGSLYHQPRALYVTNTLTSFIEACVIEISTVHPSAIIILASDFNQLSDNDIVQRTLV